MNSEQQARVDAISRAAIALSAVTSSQIAAIGHDPETNTLAVQFNPRKERGEVTGPIYHYSGFDADKYKAFSEAKSIGGHFYAQIKDETHRHPYVKVKEAVIGHGNEQQAAA